MFLLVIVSLCAVLCHASPTYNNEIINPSHSRLSSDTIFQIERELLVLEQIKQKISEEDLYIDVDTNKALSNLAFLDLSDEERDELTARYRALNHQVNELDDEAIIGYLDPKILD